MIPEMRQPRYRGRQRGFSGTRDLEAEPESQLDDPGFAEATGLPEVFDTAEIEAPGLSAENPVLMPQICGWLNRLKISHAEGRLDPFCDREVLDEVGVHVADARACGGHCGGNCRTGRQRALEGGGVDPHVFVLSGIGVADDVRVLAAGVHAHGSIRWT